MPGQKIVIHYNLTQLSVKNSFQKPHSMRTALFYDANFAQHQSSCNDVVVEFLLLPISTKAQQYYV